MKQQPKDILMSQSTAKRIKMDELIAYYRQLLTMPSQTPIILNQKLTLNPFLKDRQQFAQLQFSVHKYNQRVTNRQVKDPYEAMTYERLHSLLSQISQIETRQDQIIALTNLHKWFKEQYRLVTQRKDQGMIRYKLLPKNSETTEEPSGIPSKEEIMYQDIPSLLLERIMEPYDNLARTIHKEYDLPIRRLSQYKRKMINLGTMLQPKQQQKPPRILYPMPAKPEPPKEEEQAKEDQTEKQEQIVPGEDGAPTAQDKKDDIPQVDLGGGLGEQPQQPDEQEPPEDQPDKLAPKNKLYIEAIKTDQNRKYKGAYMHYRGTERLSERSLQQRYLRMQQEIIQKQRQNIGAIQLANQWARNRARANKNFTIKLQQRILRPKYSYSVQEQPQPQKLTAVEQIKYGFTQSLRQRPKFTDLDFSSISNRRHNIDDTLDEKKIRRDRLNELKKQYGKLLNLTEYEKREVEPSLCQQTSRRRGLSQLIRNHSKSKERLHQLEEVMKVKQRLTRGKIGLNIKMLSQGLCLPDNEEILSQIFPTKQLPNNPFMVETKKKKK